MDSCDLGASCGDGSIEQRVWIAHRQDHTNRAPTDRRRAGLDVLLYPERGVADLELGHGHGAVVTIKAVYLGCSKRLLVEDDRLGAVAAVVRASDVVPAIVWTDEDLGSFIGGPQPNHAAGIPFSPGCETCLVNLNTCNKWSQARQSGT